MHRVRSNLRYVKQYLVNIDTYYDNLTEIDEVGTIFVYTNYVRV